MYHLSIESSRGEDGAATNKRAKNPQFLDTQQNNIGSVSNVNVLTSVKLQNSKYFIIFLL